MILLLYSTTTKLYLCCINFSTFMCTTRIRFCCVLYNKKNRIFIIGSISTILITIPNNNTYSTTTKLATKKGPRDASISTNVDIGWLTRVARWARMGFAHTGWRTSMGLHYSDGGWGGVVRLWWTGVGLCAVLMDEDWVTCGGGSRCGTKNS